MIERCWCERCDGSGHASGCACAGAHWIAGCCQRCGGEGMVNKLQYDFPADRRRQATNAIVTDITNFRGWRGVK